MGTEERKPDDAKLDNVKTSVPAPPHAQLPAGVAPPGRPSRWRAWARKYSKTIKVGGALAVAAAIWRALPDPDPSLEKPSRKSEPLSSIVTVENRGWFSARDVHVYCILLRVTNAARNRYEDFNAAAGAHSTTPEIPGGKKHHVNCGIEMHVPIREAEVATVVTYRFLFLRPPRKCQAYFGDVGDDWQWREISCAEFNDRINAMMKDKP